MKRPSLHLVLFLIIDFVIAATIVVAVIAGKG